MFSETIVFCFFWCDVILKKKKNTNVCINVYILNYLNIHFVFLVLVCNFYVLFTRI